MGKPTADPAQTGTGRIPIHGGPSRTECSDSAYCMADAASG
jgi:hypothetical protein